MPTDEAPDLVLLECAAGHSWEMERPKKGKWPKYCPDHRRFFFEQLSHRLKPPRRVVLEWNEQGEMMDDDDYTRRWTKIWLDTVRLVGAVGGSWNAVDIELVERYVRAVRMSEMHRLYAQDKPYSETSRGTVRAHPGFKLSREEEAIAKGIAVELGIAPDPAVETNGNGSSGRKKEKEPYWQTRLQAEAEALGEVSTPVGPDGRAL